MMEIRKVGILGAGTMGRGIAAAIVQKGVEVLLCEKDPELAQTTLAKIAEDFDHEISRWAITEADKRSMMKKLSVTAKVADLAATDLVIEAVPEDFDLKVKLFEQLSRLCPPERVFVTNTSTLSITKMTEQLTGPERFVGVHFLHPVTKVKLVELIRGLQTSDATYQQVREFLISLGKTPIEVYEYPGYVTTRIILPMINEAMQVVLEGVATAEDVDTAMKLGYNMEVGPLALADRMGLDEVMKWMEHLFRELGDLKYRPCPILRMKVRAGHLGVKSGKGFFEY
ncbi:MAG TPA: 3-hydroxyacyl-CoA dehydrogenase NAD-binding domain-containing protein [Terriglobia bacterium]|nr:3-hydroxyacyl-CoA dehydrogenase NAD-binding domain-containing protein [Terriglobia bacterium]